MSILAKGSSSNFDPAPEGLHQAVCVDVIDLGIIEDQYMGNDRKRHMIRIRWQIDEINPKTGDRFDVGARYTLSLSEKSRLRPLLEAWRGKKFTEAELEGFDVEKLLGANCQIQITHDIKPGGKTYANVQAVVPVGKGVTLLKPLDYVREIDRKKDSAAPADSELNDDGPVPF